MNSSENQKRESLVKTIKDNNVDILWKHQYQLSDDIYTYPVDKYKESPANCPNKWNRIINLIGKESLYKKKILDIGCSEGYFAFEASKFASEVIGVDLDPVRIERANLIKEFKQNTNCQFICKDCKDLPDKDFNIAFALGLLHRIPDPIGFIQAITEISDEIIIEYKCYRSSKPIAYFAGGKYKINKFSKLYFIFSIKCLKDLLESCGFEIVAQEKLPLFTDLKFPRNMIHARRRK